MATNAEMATLAERYGPAIAEEVVPCVTTQWNFPHPLNQPWARDGICSICGEPVSMIRVGPDRSHVYSHIAEPHTRVQRWFKVDADDLYAMDDFYVRG